MRGRAAQGPSNPATQGFGQAPGTGLRWELQADKSLFAERRLFLFPRRSWLSLWRLARDRVTRKGTHRRALTTVHGAMCPQHVAPRAR